MEKLHEQMGGYNFLQLKDRVIGITTVLSSILDILPVDTEGRELRDWDNIKSFINRLGSNIPPDLAGYAVRCGAKTCSVIEINEDGITSWNDLIRAYSPELPMISHASDEGNIVLLPKATLCSKTPDGKYQVFYRGHPGEIEEEGIRVLWEGDTVIAPYSFDGKDNYTPISGKGSGKLILANAPCFHKPAAPQREVSTEIYPGIAEYMHRVWARNNPVKSNFIYSWLASYMRGEKIHQDLVICGDCSYGKTYVSEILMQMGALVVIDLEMLTYLKKKGELIVITDATYRDVNHFYNSSNRGGLANKIMFDDISFIFFIPGNRCPKSLQYAPFKCDPREYRDVELLDKLPSADLEKFIDFLLTFRYPPEYGNQKEDMIVPKMVRDYLANLNEGHWQIGYAEPKRPITHPTKDGNFISSNELYLDFSDWCMYAGVNPTSRRVFRDSVAFLMGKEESRYGNTSRGRLIEDLVNDFNRNKHIAFSY